MAKKYKLLVYTNAVEGKEDDFNDWYQNTHLQQIVSIKSFVQPSGRGEVAGGSRAGGR